MTAPDLGFIHRFVPAPAAPEAAATLLLLHGTGGDENDLLELGRMLAPGANLLSPRGKVSEHGAARFFRRLAEGVFDLEDLHARTSELAGFVRAAVDAYGLNPGRLIAVGYSNGANIAGSMLLSEPGLLPAAVLFRAMVPFVPEQPPALDGTAVFISNGRLDPLIPPQQTDDLVALLTEAGADVTLRWSEGGHGLDHGDLQAAAYWLQEKRLIAG